MNEFFAFLILSLPNKEIKNKGKILLDTDKALYILTKDGKVKIIPKKGTIKIRDKDKVYLLDNFYLKGSYKSLFKKKLKEQWRW